MRQIVSYLLIAAAGVGLLIWFAPRRPPPIVAELRSRPHIRSVEYVGPFNARLVALHVRDWPFRPRADFAGDDVAFHENLMAVQRVQHDELETVRYLVCKHGIRGVIYSDGPSERGVRDLLVRSELLRVIFHVAGFGAWENMAEMQRRELRLKAGVAGELLLGSEVATVRSIERGDVMPQQLPSSGVVLFICDGSRDLRTELMPHLGEDVLYVRATPASYPDN